MIDIIKATRDDARAAWDIRKHAVTAGCAGVYSAEQITRWTSGEPTERWADIVEHGFYVARDGGDAVATGMLTTEIGQIDAIFVRPSHMGRGIGQRMMTFLETLALEHGLDKLILESTLNAAPFYRRCGFAGDTVATHRSPRGVALDCIPMEKALVPPRA
jgi:GNAT superfamily N-acetyltransferase